MKKISLLLLTALIGVSSSSFVDHSKGPTRNSFLEQQVLALLETVRETMLTGFDDIPILDPLQVEHLHVDENLIDLPGAHITIQGLVLHYLSTFIVDDLSISISSILPLRYSVQFEAHIPTIIAEIGDYDLYISAMSYEIFGRGDGRVEVIQPRVTGSFTFAVLSMTVSNMVVELNLSSFEINKKRFAELISSRLEIVYLPACGPKDMSSEFAPFQEPQLTGLFYHEGANNFANAFLANLVPEIVTFYKDEIRDFISPLIQDLANELLEDVSIGDLFPQFLRLHHIDNMLRNGRV